MRVEVFSDVICPWCAIGKRRLERALTRFDHAGDVDVVWRAYELDPTAPPRRSGDYPGRLAAKYGMSRAQAAAANVKLTALAAAEGLDFHFDKVKPGNTFDAHRLLHYAATTGPHRQDVLKERLFRAYFTDGVAVGEKEPLLQVAVEAGFDATGCTAVLDSDRYEAEVRADEREALDLGVSGVPFFLVDGRFAVAGAQDPDTLLLALQRAWAKGPGLDASTQNGGASCAVDDVAH